MSQFFETQERSRSVKIQTLHTSILMLWRKKIKEKRNNTSWK